MRALPLLVLAGLLPGNAAAETTAQALAGSEWRPQVIAADLLPEDAPIFVQFGGDEQLSGHAGCNRFTARYRLTDGAIEVSGLGTTRMQCDDETMTRETAFLAALVSARRFEREGTRLTLSGGDGVVSARLVQTDWD